MYMYMNMSMYMYRCMCMCKCMCKCMSICKWVCVWLPTDYISWHSNIISPYHRCMKSLVEYSTRGVFTSCHTSYNRFLTQWQIHTRSTNFCSFLLRSGTRSFLFLWIHLHQPWFPILLFHVSCPCMCWFSFFYMFSSGIIDMFIRHYDNFW